MKNFSNSSNYKNARVYNNNGGQIPAGGYECVVKNVKYAKYDWGDRIEMAFDVTAGDFQNFFQDKFDADTSENNKWKGVFRLSVPKDDGSQEDGWTMNRFKTTMDHFEKSNDGYVWNWDESTLKGKSIGIIFRTRYTNINGRNISYSEACRTASIDDIRSGNFKVPDEYIDKSYDRSAVANDNAGSDDDFMSIDASKEEEIPF